MFFSEAFLLKCAINQGGQNEQGHFSIANLNLKIHIDNEKQYYYILKLKSIGDNVIYM